jgi:hypothetical protein
MMTVKGPNDIQVGDWLFYQRQFRLVVRIQNDSRGKFVHFDNGGHLFLKYSDTIMASVDVLR